MTPACRLYQCFQRKDKYNMAQKTNYFFQNVTNIKKILKSLSAGDF